MAVDAANRPPASEGRGRFGGCWPARPGQRSLWSDVDALKRAEVDRRLACAVHDVAAVALVQVQVPAAGELHRLDAGHGAGLIRDHAAGARDEVLERVDD